MTSEAENDEPLDVLNLPQLYQRPTASQLLDVLADLSVVPPSWSGSAPAVRRKIKSEGVPAYLTKIISSPLLWIEDDAEKEAIWETAAQRLSERSGRSGMGNFSRTFSIPLQVPRVANNATAELKEAHSLADTSIDIVLHEPGLSEDNLGLKTWAASYMLAKRLPLLTEIIPPLLEASEPHILELGSGTGLVGIAAAAVLKARVLLTDLPTIVPNLKRNVEVNEKSVSEHGGVLQAGVLD